MNKSTIVTIGVVVMIAIAALTLFGAYASYSNKEVRLKNQILAKKRANQSDYDAVWKIIQQQAGVADKYEEGFKSVFTQMTDSRYGNDSGLLAKFVTESNPNFSTKLLEQLNNSIESQRVSFSTRQKELADLKAAHDSLLEGVPSGWFVGGRPPVEIVIVTSSRTDKAFETGKDDNVDLFKK